MNSRTYIVTSPDFSALNMVLKVRFISVSFVVLVVTCLALRLIKLEASIISVARAYIITALVNILKTFYTFRRIGLPMPEVVRITIEELSLVLPEKVFCPKFYAIVWDSLQFITFLLVVCSLNVFPRTVVSVVGMVATRIFIMASVFMTHSSVTVGISSLVIVVICPSLFSKTIVDIVVSIVLAMVLGMLKVVPRPFVTEPSRSRPLTLKSVSV